LPPLADIRELGPMGDPQSDFVEALATVIEESESAEDQNANVVPIQQSEA
jgi:hypothetical protein